MGFSLDYLEGFSLEKFISFIKKRNQDFYLLFLTWLDSYRREYFDLSHFIDYVVDRNVEFYDLLLVWLDEFEKSGGS